MNRLLLTLSFALICVAAHSVSQAGSPLPPGPIKFGGDGSVTPAVGDCVNILALNSSGTTVTSAGNPCGTGTVSPGTAGQVAMYSSTGTAVGGVAPLAALGSQATGTNLGIPQGAPTGTVVPLTRTVYYAQDYGAICNGSHHPVSTVLGVSTAATLASYAKATGWTPYSFVTNSTWNNVEVALPMTVAAASGATTLYFDSTLNIPVGAVVSGPQVSTSPVPTVSAVSNPGTVTQVTNGVTSTNGTKSITVTSGTPTPVGSHPTPQTGLSVNDYVVSSTATNITLKFGITSASIASGTTLTFYPPASVTITGTGLTAAKPSVQSAASTATVNYWVYFTWPTTDAMAAAAEMDFIGTQAAIEAATNAGGGVVQMPSGTCVFDNSTVSGSGLNSLILHETTTGGQGMPVAGVDLIGNGVSSTTLSWPTELGAGRAALSNGVPYATFDNGLGHYGYDFYYGRLSDMSIVGPNGQNQQTIGTIPYYTWGVINGARREVDRLVVTGFYVGMTAEGVDHTRWGTVYSFGNTYNLRFGPASTSLYGGDIWDHLEVSGAGLADISIDKSGYWASTNINELYCAYAPKCIQLEAGTADSYAQPQGNSMIDDTVFNTNAEDLGGCFICDNNYGPNFPAYSSPLAGGEFSAQQISFYSLGMSYNAAKQPAGSPIQFWLELPIFYDSRFQFANFSPPPIGGMQGAVYIDQANFGLGGIYFEGAFTNLLSSSTWNTTPFFVVYGATYDQAQYSIRVCEPQSWCGHVETVNSGVNIGQGVPLDYTSGVGGADLSVEKSTGTLPFGGLMMSTWSSGAAVVATKICTSVAGTNGVTVPTSGTATAGHFAALASGGTITNGTLGGSAPIIGTIMQVSGSTARVNVGPNGSCD